MRKLTSILLIFTMTVTMCFGSFGGVYASPSSILSKLYPFSDCTWEKIGNLVAQAEAGDITLSDFWSVGDTKSVTLTTGETIELQIADFNHDTFGDGTTAPITLVMKNCLKTAIPYHLVTAAVSYPESYINAYIHTNIYEKLPDDLKALVAPVNKRCHTGDYEYTEITETVWLLSEMEVQGTKSDGTQVIYEGEEYPIFSDDANKIKSINGEADSWLLRDIDFEDSNYVCGVDPSGLATNLEVGGVAPAGVVVGMCLRGAASSTDEESVIDVTVPEVITLDVDKSKNYTSAVNVKNNSSTMKVNVLLSATPYGDWKLVSSSTDFSSMTVDQKKLFLIAEDSSQGDIDLSASPYSFDLLTSSDNSFNLKGKTGPVSENVEGEQCLTLIMKISEIN